MLEVDLHSLWDAWCSVDARQARRGKKAHRFVVSEPCHPVLQQASPWSTKQCLSKAPGKQCSIDSSQHPNVQLQFRLPAQQRKIVRMPLPFASITGVGSSSNEFSVSVPALVRTKSAAPASTKPPSTKEERILISEVEVVGVDGELKDIARSVLRTRPMFAYTFEEVKQDVARVFATGWFKECAPDAEDTRDGVKLIIKVKPNEEVRGMVASGNDVMPQDVIQTAFKDLYGKRLNYVTLRQAVNSLDHWYSERGILGQVTDVDFADGVITLDCAEAVVGSVSLSFLDPAGQQPAEKHRTRDEIITRHITTKPGQVYNLKQAKRDIASIYATGLFEDVNITPKESDHSSETAPKVDLVVNLIERKTGGLGAGGGLSSQARGDGAMPGIVGSFSYSERNLFGLNQKLTALVELGQVDKIFKIQHTDPWILGDPHRTSRTIQLLNNRASAAAVHGREETDLTHGHTHGSNSRSVGSTAVMNGARQHTGGEPVSDLVIGRLLGSVEYARPLSDNWSGTLGVTMCRTTCLNSTGTPVSVDCYGAPLTYSGGPSDRMAILATSTSYTAPSDGATLQFSLDAALPARRDWLRFTRLRARVDKPFPVGPLTLHCRARGGSVLGNLPPYEAFTIGGTNSVRGYSEGGVGTGRHWLETTAELRFPLLSMLSGCVFADYGTDFDSGTTVIGDPAGARGKPGKGHAVGAGIRVDTPVGPLRLEYAWNAARHGRFHVGVGYD